MQRPAPALRRLLAAGAALTALHAPSAMAQTQPYLGQIMCGAWDFAPQGWAMLNGQLMSIQSNTALFSLLGTRFGGNGQTTFALPDMRGRFMMHAGAGPGLTLRNPGDKGGSETFNLQLGQLPPHSHQVGIAPVAAELKSPKPGATGADVAVFKGTSSSTTPTGSGTPVPSMPPYLVINCMIAYDGEWPTRP